MISRYLDITVTTPCTKYFQGEGPLEFPGPENATFRKVVFLKLNNYKNYKNATVRKKRKKIIKSITPGLMLP